ncbi:MAG: SurA N-terminal domain-containing protein [Bacteroidales bacterium]|jgi:peptidyl-prolyl cis-trans isomerase D|nr:SurA N-terminal domain-containing protein [Bacteroidales bacterium]
MAAIGEIRKHGVLLMVIIGIALLAFLLGDFNKISTFFSDKYTMGKIDGQKVDDPYRVYYEQNTDLWKFMYNKATLEESETYQIHEITWNSLVNEMLLDKQLKALGLEYTDEMKENAVLEMMASLRTQEPNQMLAQLVDILSKQYGIENAINIITNIEDYKNEEGARSIYNACKAIEHFDLMDKKQRAYFALAQGSLYFSDEMAKKLTDDNQSALVKLLSVTVNAPAFAEIKANVTDAEMKAYYNEHKGKFENKQSLRDIDVAIFPVNPTPEDMQAIEDTVKSKYQRFLEASSIAEFNIAESFPPLDSLYVTVDDITADEFDSIIFKRPVGSLIEPFIYQNQTWYFGKVYGAAMRPDSIQVAFLVLDYKTQVNPNSMRSRKQAKAECDSLKQLIDSQQASIFQLTPNYLGGRQATDTVMWLPERGIIGNLYSELINTSPGGTYVYNDRQGIYVIYQVLTKTPMKEKRLYALYPFEIKASDATVKQIKADATQLMTSSNTIDLFTENTGKQGIQVIKGVDVTSMAATIGQLPNCRTVVSWAFNDETKLGAISDVYNLSNNNMYAVAALRTVKNKGVPKFEEIKTAIEQEMLDAKKVDLVAEKIRAELASSNDYAALAQKWGARFTDSTMLTFTGEIYQNAGVENSAIGKIFTLPATAQNEVVTGKFNVYAISVYKEEKANSTSDMKAILRNMVLGGGRNEMSILEGLKDKVPILDRRYVFYAQ